MKRLFSSEIWPLVDAAGPHGAWTPERRWSKEQRADWLKEDGQWSKRPGWNTRVPDQNALSMAVTLLRPRCIVDTGTHEGISAAVLAQAAPEGARLLTVDYDGDPSMPLAPPKPGDDYASHADWAELALIRRENLAELRRLRPDMTIEFLDGDSRRTLRRAIERFCPDGWDFWYQDSMHHYEGILTEWLQMVPFAAEGAVAIFDDVEENAHDPHPWFQHCRDAEQDRWELRATHRGNHQLWMQRRDGSPA